MMHPKSVVLPDNINADRELERAFKFIRRKDFFALVTVYFENCPKTSVEMFN